MELLTEEEIRVLGSLIEKENTTPDYYPMTINSIVNACNQKSSRNPVVLYDESLVENTIDELIKKHLVSKVTGGDNRVPKYRQLFTEHYDLSKAETAAICVLFLRGAQTIGEIRGRTNRIYEYNDLSETEETLSGLINSRDEPFVVKLPRDSGRENRYTHLFCNSFEISSYAPENKVNNSDRIGKLEKKIDELKESFNNLKVEFEEFKKQFE